MAQVRVILLIHLGLKIARMRLHHRKVALLVPDDNLLRITLAQKLFGLVIPVIFHLG